MSVDLFEKIQKLSCMMPFLAFADHCPGGDIECSEK